jgi:UDP-N-acetyl-D-mannosaminuronic acid dehydrogenase
MAFKPECDDPRDSLSYKLRDLLRPECRRVLCTDPYVPDPELVELDEVLQQADLLVVGTPHDCYRVLKCRQPVIDLTGSLQGSHSNGALVRKPHAVRRKASRNGRFVVSANGQARQRKRA